jgi:uncharacterized protein
MRKNILHCLIVSFLMMMVLYLPIAVAEAIPRVKISVFNFGSVNMEASGYGTTVTSMLMNNLGAEHFLDVLDRKELEAFLNLNDFQQNDNLENVVNIGTRLGLNAIIVGSVEKKSSIVIVTCKVIQIEQKKTILNKQVRAFGDAGLTSEMKKLSSIISTTISNVDSKEGGDKSTLGPVNVQKRSGNKRISLSWEEPPGMKAAGYTIFRSNMESGPFVRIAQIDRPEYIDQNVESKKTYYYKIQAFNNKGLQSDFSSIISGETALTPSPPVILKVGGLVKSIQLTWSPSPMASDDPSKLKGYKLYRAKTPSGPYVEVANVQGSDLGIGADATMTIDQLSKVSYVIKGLADGEDYYYKLTAYNEKNLESDFSSYVKGAAIPVVKGLTAQGDMSRAIKLTWDPIGSTVIKGYCIYRSVSDKEGFVKIKKIDASSTEKNGDYTDKEGLGDNERFYYRITAFEESDMETSPSAVASAVTKGKPPIPQGLIAKSGLVRKVELTWTANPQEEIEGYNLYWSKEKSEKYQLLSRIESRTTNNFTHGNIIEKLKDNTTYYYKIASYNKYRVESDRTEAAEATTKKRPPKPTGLTGELHEGKLEITWKAVNEPDIDHYVVYEKVFFLPVRIGAEKKTSYTGMVQLEGVKKVYVVTAVDKDGLDSEPSEEITITGK